jgi:signal transduction histidine kinase
MQRRQNRCDVCTMTEIELTLELSFAIDWNQLCLNRSSRTSYRVKLNKTSSKISLPLSQKANGTNAGRRGLYYRVKLGVVIDIAIILGISSVVYFILQTSYEQQVRSSILDQQRERQIQYSKVVARNIGSDLDSLMNRLQSVALSKPMQDGEYATATTTKLLQQAYDKASRITTVDGIYILDENNMVVNYFNPSIQRPGYIGYDSSLLPPVVEYQSNLPNSTYSMSYKSTVDGKLRISLMHPVYNIESGKYLGAVSMALLLDPFLAHYGNLYDANSQYLAVLDRNATILSSPFRENVGLNFFSSIPAQGSSRAADDHYRKVLSGHSNAAIFEYRTGERLNTGEPIMLGGKPIYFVFVVTPMNVIYAQIDSIIAAQRTGFYLLQDGIAGAIAISLFFLFRWSTILERAVKDRTAEIAEANKSLSRSNEQLAATTLELQAANEQLKVQDKMQREFINIAAHELRTPITPILVSLHLAQKVKTADGTPQTILAEGQAEMIERNAKRLEKLAADVLTIPRIEGKGLQLHKEPVELNKEIKQAISDFMTLVKPEERIDSILESSGEPIIVDADKSKLSEVLSNLIRNAVRFSPAGGK